ncbi:hypothetical protein J7L27_05655 [Candidatus Bathyarchaeota archaeon]|nr:hypothetical protein [Candidatus Bathyarchaeota archaeon]
MPYFSVKVSRVSAASGVILATESIVNNGSLIFFFDCLQRLINFPTSLWLLRYSSIIIVTSPTTSDSSQNMSISTISPL